MEKTSRLENIQVLRALAALLVLLFHLGGLGKAVKEVTAFEFPEGFFGVDLFFVISGFIMIYITRKNWGLKKSFLVSRVLRVYPLYWISIFLFPISFNRLIAVFEGDPHQEFFYFLKSFALYPALTLDGKLEPAYFIGWSLSFEMLFYLVMVVVMFTKPRFLSLKIFTVFILFYYLSSSLPFSAESVFLRYNIYFDFILGVLAAEIYFAKKLSIWMLIFLLPISVYLFVQSMAPDLRIFNFGIPAFTILLFALYLEDKGVKLPKQVSVLGDSSYSLYLLHPIILWLFAKPFAFLFPLFGPWGDLPFIVVMCILISVVFYYLVEKPLYNFCKYSAKKIKLLE